MKNCCTKSVPTQNRQFPNWIKSNNPEENCVWNTNCLTASVIPEPFLAQWCISYRKQSLDTGPKWLNKPHHSLHHSLRLLYILNLQPNVKLFMLNHHYYNKRLEQKWLHMFFTHPKIITLWAIIQHDGGLEWRTSSCFQ